MKSYNFMKENKGKQPTNDRYNSSIMQSTSGDFYSYGYHYPLLFKVGNLWFVNDYGYSATTGKHISWARGLADYSVELPPRTSVNLDNIGYALEVELDELDEKLKNKRKDTQIYKSILLHKHEVIDTINALANDNI